MLGPVDEQPVSEILPGLYRAVLDGVADLEACGRRTEAAAIRAEGTHIYSRSWNANAARRLRLLRARADRFADADARPRTRYEVVLDLLRRKADLERRTA